MTTLKPRPPRDETEFASVAGLIQRVFAHEPTTLEAHLALVGARRFAPESLPTIWEGSEAVAAVQAIPCDIALLGTWVPGGIITMVATDEAFRGRGHMRACMHAAHRWLIETGRPLGLLYGVPPIYPRFDYRPVMVRSDVRYPLVEAEAGTRLRGATVGDGRNIAELFNHCEVQRSCSVRRPAAEWVWSAPRSQHVMVVLDGPAGLAGYARYAVHDGSAFHVTESANLPGYEASMVAALHARAAEHGCQHVVLQLMPDHPLTTEVNRRATQLEISGVEVTVRPPQAGMLAVLDASAVMEALRPEVERRLDGQGLQLTAGDRISLTFGDGGPAVHVPDPADLAHLLSGYPGVQALHQWERLWANTSGLEIAARAFPTEWPRWTPAPYWGE